MTTINFLKLREEAHIYQRVTFNEIFQNYEFNRKDELNFRKSVKSIFLRAIISEETSGIRKFKNDEYDVRNIQIFEVNLNSTSNIRHLETILHTIFPNHIIIIFKYEEISRISLSLKRLSKIESKKTVIVRECNTRFYKLDKLMEEYVQHFNIYKLNHKNQQELYLYLMKVAEYQRIIKYINRLPNLDSRINVTTILEKITYLEEKVTYYQLEKEKGRQLAQRMEAHQKLSNYKQKYDNLVQKFKEEL